MKAAEPVYRDILGKYGCELVEFHDKKHIKLKCNKCGAVHTEQDLFIKMRDKEGATPCSDCIPKLSTTSVAETMVADYVKSLGFNTSHYDRQFIGPYGAGIVVEDRKVIIEYDGLKWHDEEHHHNDYHLEKTLLAEAAGYHLIHLFSDEWENKQDIVKSRIANALGVRDGRIVYARKCVVKEVPDAVAKIFLSENHLQGACVSKYRYGLYQDDELLALMTFGQSRFMTADTELLRFAPR